MSGLTTENVTAEPRDASQSSSAPDMANTRIPRALEMLEVLDTVMNFAENATLAACARVSSRWSALALDHLWRHMESIVPIMELISPLALPEVDDDDDEAWVFSRNPGEADWTRFRAHAKRVRSLTFDDTSPIHKEPGTFISNSAVAAATLVHRFGSSFLPNLRSLVWILSRGDTFMSILPFVPPGLETLFLVVSPEVPATPAQQLLLCLADRTPELQRFTLTTPLPVASCASALQRWISGAPNLREVWLPRLYLTPGVAKALGALPNLTGLYIDWEYPQPFNGEGRAFTFTGGAFPALKDLDFDSDIITATDLVRSSPPFNQLAELTIGCAQFNCNSDLERLTVNIASICPAIEKIFLHLSSDKTIPTTPIPFNVFRNLFPCEKLHSVSLSHDWPMDLCESDVVDMGNAWPRLQELYLCHDAYRDCTPAGSGVSVDLLPKLAGACPGLQRLGLYLRQDIIPRFDGQLNPKVQFRKLLELDLGVSSIPGGEIGTLAFFLASLLPIGAEITFGRSLWTMATAVGETWDTSSWREVKRIRELATRSKAVIQEEAK